VPCQWQCCIVALILNSDPCGRWEAEEKSLLCIWYGHQRDALIPPKIGWAAPVKDIVATGYSQRLRSSDDHFNGLVILLIR
jgi:hypothetical protein